jgi:hypothetical protein
LPKRAFNIKLRVGFRRVGIERVFCVWNPRGQQADFKFNLRLDINIVKRSLVSYIQNMPVGFVRHDLANITQNLRNFIF